LQILYVYHDLTLIVCQYIFIVICRGGAADKSSAEKAIFQEFTLVQNRILCRIGASQGRGQRAQTGFPKYEIDNQYFRSD
jgi:hypothetical protein